MQRAVLQTDAERYVIVDYLAEGGMGAIYLGKKVGMGGFEKEVVLKQLLPEFTSQPEFIDLFLREAKLSASLDHANIVHTIDLVAAGYDYFIVMEYVRGGDLRTILRRIKRRHQRLSPAAALFVAREVLNALAYAHGKRSGDGKPLNLIHRDISPSNIMISASGEVKLADFGIAKVSTHKSIFYRVKGKVGYMSPEQAYGDRPIDHRSDLYALAVCFYEMIAGERLFVADLLATPDQIFQQPLPPLEGQPGMPRGLDRVLSKTLSIDPDLRYQTAAEFQEALVEIAYDNEMMLTAPDLAEELCDKCGASPESWNRDEDDDVQEPGGGTAVLSEQSDEGDAGQFSGVELTSVLTQATAASRLQQPQGDEQTRELSVDRASWSDPGTAAAPPVFDETDIHGDYGDGELTADAPAPGSDAADELTSHYWPATDDPGEDEPPTHAYHDFSDNIATRAAARSPFETVAEASSPTPSLQSESPWNRGGPRDDGEENTRALRRSPHRHRTDDHDLLQMVSGPVVADPVIEPPAREPTAEMSHPSVDEALVAGAERPPVPPEPAEDLVEATPRPRADGAPAGRARRTGMLIAAATLLLLAVGIVAAIGLSGPDLSTAESSPPSPPAASVQKRARLAALAVDARRPSVPFDSSVAEPDKAVQTESQAPPPSSPPRADAESNVVSVTVLSSPNHAEVYLDGVHQCATTCTVEGLEQKHIYVLSVRRKTYVTWSTLLDMRRERHRRVKAYLSEEPHHGDVGYLVIRSRPVASVTIDGKAIGRVTSAGRIPLPPGQYEITLKAPQRRRAPRFSVTIKRGRTVTVRKRF